MANMIEIMDELRSKIDAYNTALFTIDSYKSEIEESEKILGDLSDKMLLGVAHTYGKDSREYEKAGGVRKSDGFANAKGERIRRSSVSRLKAGAEEPTNT